MWDCVYNSTKTCYQCTAEIWTHCFTCKNLIKLIKCFICVCHMNINSALLTMVHIQVTCHYFIDEYWLTFSTLYYSYNFHLIELLFNRIKIQFTEVITVTGNYCSSKVAFKSQRYIFLLEPFSFRGAAHIWANTVCNYCNIKISFWGMSQKNDRQQNVIN